MARKRLTVTAKRGGKTVRYETTDKGAVGRTPEEKRWYRPTTSATGWSKSLPAKERRRLFLKAHEGNLLSAGRAIMGLHNVSTDLLTRLKTGQDATYFFAEHKKKESKKR